MHSNCLDSGALDGIGQPLLIVSVFGHTGFNGVALCVAGFVPGDSVVWLFKARGVMAYTVYFPGRSSL